VSSATPPPIWVKILITPARLNGLVTVPFPFSYTICLHRRQNAPMTTLGAVRSTKRRAILVAIHDVEPATYERCALIRDWLADHGVERVTLLVIPARDLHPLHDRRPEIAGWLSQRQECGDAIAQHGFQHLQLRRPAWPRQAFTRVAHAGEPEFVGLDGDETSRAVEAGWRVLKLAGVEPRGFVAPAYAYTQALRETLSTRFEWWAELLSLRRGDDRRPLSSPPISVAGRGAIGRAVSPGVLRVGALAAGSTLRIDVHPRDLGCTRHMLALESVLRHASGRTALTYDDLAASA
jgi:predicted deacetylase